MAIQLLSHSAGRNALRQLTWCMPTVRNEKAARPVLQSNVAGTAQQPLMLPASVTSLANVKPGRRFG